MYRNILKSFSFEDSEPIIVTDSKNQILFCTKKAAGIIGIKQADLYNKKFPYFNKKKIKSINSRKKETIYSIRPVLFKWNKKNIVIYLFIREKESLPYKQIVQPAKAEAALKESEERFRSVIEGSHLGVWDWNLLTGELKRNEYWAKMLGYSLNELNLTIDQWTQLIHPEDKNFVWQSVQDHLNGKTSMYKVECRLRTKGGDYKWILDLGRIVKRNAKGKPTRFSGVHYDITERKLAELALRDSQLRYQVFLENSTDGIHRTEFVKPIDINLPIETQIDLIYEYGRIVEYNKTFRLMYGIPESKEIKGMHVDFFHGSRNNELNRRGMRQLIENGYRIINGESEERMYDGSTVYFSNNANGIVEDGKLVRIWGTQTDINERKRAENALKESEERFKLVIEGSQLGFWDWNLETGEMKRNEYWAHMLGYSLNELQPTIDQWTRLIHPDDKEFVWQSVQDHLNGITNMYKVECRLKMKDGDYKWILDLGRIVEYDMAGKPLRFSGIHSDITERKLIEIALKDSQVRYQTFLEHSSDGIYRLEFRNSIDIHLPSDVQIELLYDNAYVAEYNKIFKTMYGIPEVKNIIGINLVEFHGGRDNQVNRNALRKFIESGYRVTNEETVERMFDGSIIYFSNSTVGIIENDKLIRIWGTQTDITESKTAQEELIKAKEKAESSDKLKSEFLAQISHEIRTPLNVTLSYSELIKDSLGKDLTAEQNEYIEAINLAGKRLIRTVDLILNTSEMQIGSYEPIWEKIDLKKDVIEPIKSEIQKYAAKKNLIMKFTNNLSDEMIFADQYSINQIFINLIDNAIKYTEEGKVEVILDKNEKNEVKMTIQDTGIGMSKDYLKNIFTPFAQEEKGYSRKFEGSGLGLSLVKKYCDLNNAFINVESKKGLGTKFELVFPNKKNKY